ncbi:glycosyltransferase family 2 protein [candidate division KSB1 bacterium]|nr:glycosyltransferase family 2 protein [candidate division KSB1 bacterium]
MKNQILIAIPAYNEEKYIDCVLCDIKKDYPQLDILVVNDGSCDRTGEILRNSNTFTIDHPVNRGKGAAILTAIRYAKSKGYQWILTLDADGQHAVSQMSGFIEKIASDRWDVIIGNRMERHQNMPFHRLLSNGTTSIMVSLCAGGIRIYDSQCGFRAIRLCFVNPKHYRQKGFQLESEMLIKLAMLGARITHERISTIYGDEASSMAMIGDTIKFIRLILYRFWWT